MLIDAGAPLDTKDKDGCTALDLAIENGHSDIVELIKSHVERQIERQGYAFDLNI